MAAPALREVVEAVGNTAQVQPAVQPPLQETTGGNSAAKAGCSWKPCIARRQCHSAAERYVPRPHYCPPQSSCPSSARWQHPHPYCCNGARSLRNRRLHPKGCRPRPSPQRSHPVCRGQAPAVHSPCSTGLRPRTNPAVYQVWASLLRGGLGVQIRRRSG